MKSRPALAQPPHPSPYTSQFSGVQFSLSSKAIRAYASLVFRISSLASCLLIGAVCLFVGCAAEGPPHPPRVQRPVRIDDLRVQQTGFTLRLSFRRPLLATDGRQLTKPIEVRIYRDITPAQKKAPEPFRAAKPWVSLSASELPAYMQGPAIVYDDRLSRRELSELLGSSISFAVVTLTRSFRGRPRVSDLSNVAGIKLLDVSPPLRGLSVKLTPNGVDLRWAAPTRSLTGGPLPPVVAYRIYRSTRNHTGRYHLLHQTVKPQYLDRNFLFNQTYFYRVRAVFEVQPDLAESSNSTPVSVTPHDIFPPPIPSGLTAAYTGRSVELIWKPGTALNLAGYNIYRQVPGKTPQRLNSHLLLTPFFTDTRAEPRHQYSYWVTSVSLAHNESKPSAKVSMNTS